VVLATASNNGHAIFTRIEHQQNVPFCSSYDPPNGRAAILRVRKDCIGSSSSVGVCVEVRLFHADSHQRLPYDELRAQARKEVVRSGLIQSAGAGDVKAAFALHAGFWPFVREFEIAIDRRALPRAPLALKFGPSSTRTCFATLARAVREMKNEEGSHATLWQEDAAELGLEFREGPLVAGVTELIESAYAHDIVVFFAVLAGTEFIAEELSRYLTQSKDFVALFGRSRWAWGDVHLLPHQDGPSHLEIDVDLARAYSPTDDVAFIKRMIENTILLFGRAAKDVYQSLMPLHEGSEWRV